MHTILVSLVVFPLAVGALAVGLLFGRPPLKGSCGGVACRLGMDCQGCRRTGKERV